MKIKIPRGMEKTKGGLDKPLLGPRKPAPVKPGLLKATQGLDEGGVAKVQGKILGGYAPRMFGKLRDMVPKGKKAIRKASKPV